MIAWVKESYGSKKELVNIVKVQKIVVKYKYYSHTQYLLSNGSVISPIDINGNYKHGFDVQFVNPKSKIEEVYYTMEKDNLIKCSYPFSKELKIDLVLKKGLAVP